MRWIWIFFVSVSSSLFAEPALRNSFVKVIVHKQEMDVHEPWKNGRIHTEEHVGTVVRFDHNQEKGILIKATALSFQKRIEMQTLSGEWITELHPRFIDYEVNLAVLQSSDMKTLNALPALMVSERELSLEEEAYLYKLESDRHIDRLKGSLRKVNAGERTDTSSYPIINYIFKFPRKELGWSEPILIQDKLVAIAVGEDEEDNVHTIPGTLISHFLKDELNKNYKGFPSIELEYSTQYSPDTREALGIPNTNDGVLVTAVSKESSFFGKIQKGDLILKINEKKIHVDGTYIHPVWGDISASILTYKNYAGDSVSVEVLQNKKRKTYHGILNRYDSNKVLIPYYHNQGKIPFLIVGGLVFQELNRPYIRSWGKNWMGDAPSSFLYMWVYKNSMPNHAHERIMILNQVLADVINKGYENISNVIVKTVNGYQIHSFSDLKEALDHPIYKNKEYFVQIGLDLGEGEIILSLNDIHQSMERIGNNYGIYDKTAFFSPNIGIKQSPHLQ